jgi:hypothetical protein
MSNHASSQPYIVFQHKNRVGLGLPILIQILMIGVFALPLSLPLLTWKLIPENPALLILWPISILPWTMLYLLARLISRYGLIVYSNGDTTLIFPFNTTTIKGEQLGSIVVEKNYMAATKSYMSWVRFADAQSNVLASLSLSAIPSEAMTKYLVALKSTKPDLVIKQ